MPRFRLIIAFDLGKDFETFCPFCIGPFSNLVVRKPFHSIAFRGILVFTTTEWSLSIFSRDSGVQSTGRERQDETGEPFNTL